MSMRFLNTSSNGVSDSGPGAHSVGEQFQCMWGHPDHAQLHCNDLIRGYDVPAHLREVHGIRGNDKDPFTCMWKQCYRVIKRESMARHVEEVHMGIVYPCTACGQTFTRKDTLSKHKKNQQH